MTEIIISFINYIAVNFIRSSSDEMQLFSASIFDLAASIR